MPNKKNIAKRVYDYLMNNFIGLLYANRLKKTQPIFILGCGHSGTTLLLKILANHSKLYGIPYESKVFEGSYIRYSKLVRWYKEVNVNLQKRWVEKTPRHINYIERIFKVFPDARVIFLVRNGKNVVISHRKRFISSTFQERWVYENKNGINYLNDERVLLVKFEDLISNPSTALMRLCNHINVTFEEELLESNTDNFKFRGTEDNIETEILKKRLTQINSPISNDSIRQTHVPNEEEKEYFSNDINFIELMKFFKYE